MKKENRKVVGAVLVLITGVIAGISLYRGKTRKRIQVGYHEGSFFTAKDTAMRKEPDIHSEEIFQIPKEELLEAPVFEKDWVKVKYKGKEGYVPTGSVYCFKYDPKFFDM